MRIFRVLLVLCVILACASAAVRRPRAEEDPANNEIDDDDDDDDDNRLDAPNGTAHDGDDDDDDDDDDSDSRERLQYASIKSRAIAMDRGLCKKLSRYHPHYPRCQDYCERLNHWMGMCRRDSCHCYS